MDERTETSPINDDEKKVFDFVRAAFAGNSLGVVRCIYRGSPAAVLAHVEADEETDTYNVVPLAVLITPDDLPFLEQPKE